MLSAGTLVWISVKPLLKMAITTGAGILLTKHDLFGPVAARGTGQVLVNVTLPALLFSKIVPSFTSDNIKELGPLLLIGTLYQLMGLLCAFFVRQFFWVPHRFRYGILAAGTWGNWGDIPTAVITSITGAAPFNGTEDSDLAVAYISVFILVFYVSLFPLGGHRLIAQDFKGPDLTDDEVRDSFSTKVRKTGQAIAASPANVANFFRSRKVVWSQSEKTVSTSFDVTPQRDAEKAPPSGVFTPTETLIEAENLEGQVYARSATCVSAGEAKPTKQVAFEMDETLAKETGDAELKLSSLPFAAVAYAASGSAGTSVQDENANTERPECNLASSYADRGSDDQSGPSVSSSRRRKSHAQQFLAILRSFNTPPTLSIFLAFPIALVPRLKNLFVTMPGSPHAPDGLAPLALLMDTATFIGAASVPLGLICLGSALARLTVPKPWTRLPLGAIGMFSILKLFVMPVLGVLLCKLFTDAIPLINVNDKVLRFVCIFFSSVPTATTQVFLTQLHSPDGNAEHLSAFLVPQYASMFLSMTSLNAYALYTLYP